jgi:hypothetical protein
MADHSPDVKSSTINWFRKPFPPVESLRDIFLISLGSGVFVVSFLIIFQPFGIESVEGLFFYLCGYGLIDFTVTLLNLILWPRILVKTGKMGEWTIGKSLLVITWILLSIALANYIYGEYLVPQEFVEGLKLLDREGLLSWIFMTFSVGVIPVILALYLIEKHLGRRNQSLAEEYNREVADHPASGNQKEIVIETGRDTLLKIQTPDLICVRAEGGNYASVFWSTESGLQKGLARLTLVGFMEHCEGIENIVRCHRSYIINLNKVQSFRGNARSVTVRLAGLDFEVPVSRSFPRIRLTRPV